MEARSPEYWLGRAAEAKFLASRVRNVTVQRQLLEMARHYQNKAHDPRLGLRVVRLQPEMLE